MLKRIGRSAALVTLVVLPLCLMAGTTMTYDATCKYTGWDKKVKYSGKCEGNWGNMMHDNGTMVVRYMMTFRKGGQITVYTYENGLASVNDVPAKVLIDNDKMVKVLTAEGEIYEFTQTPGEH